MFAPAQLFVDAGAGFEVVVDLKGALGLACLHEEVSPLEVVVLVGGVLGCQLFVDGCSLFEHIASLVHIGQEALVPCIAGLGRGGLFGQVEGFGVVVLLGVDAGQFESGGVVLAVFFQNFLERFDGFFLVAQQAVFIGFDEELLAFDLFFGKTTIVLSWQEEGEYQEQECAFCGKGHEVCFE